MRRRHAAFTLIELLVVISIIALLLGILLPALAEARRSARLTIDVTRMKEHGTGAHNFASEKRGRAPNGPPGRGVIEGQGASANTGSIGRPAVFYADLLFIPHNGWRFPGGIRHDLTWNLYHIAFGDYIAGDRSGVELLDEVFLSSGPGSSDIADAWSDIREGRSPAEGVRSDWSTGGSPFFIGDPPRTWLIGGTERPSEGAYLSGSFRYSLAGLQGSSETNSKSFWGRPYQGTWLESGGWTSRQWVDFRAFTQLSDFRHPTKKVMFWEQYASNNRNADLYAAPGADCPLVMVDGSASVRRPEREMPQFWEVFSDVEGERRGTSMEYAERFFQYEPPSGGRPGGFDPEGRISAWFLHTNGGSEGRDF
ncbi:MAG: prepilin-type N-terminal cleavage/methylation domain-containing protein [Planctomycetota bacterium]|nr:prepilin-type N-terminal cleavage/methylation domain-containing protein [Planctomycetota bacterium]